MIFNIISAIVVQYKRANILEYAIDKKDNIFNEIILFFIFIILEILFNKLFTTYEKKFVLNNAENRRNKIMLKDLNTNHRITDSNKSKVLSILTNQIDIVKNMYDKSITTLIYLSLKSIIIVLLMSKTNIIITIIVLITLLVQILLPKIFGKILSNKNQYYIKTMEQYTKK